MPSIPVFISSTFDDFHLERDALRTVVVPRLDERVVHLGCRVELIDLRTGVAGAGLDDEVAADRRVLEVCVSEIERSRPIFLALLGHRYGWMPDLHLTNEVALRSDIPAFSDPISVTELEVNVATSGSSRGESSRTLIAMLRDDHADLPSTFRLGIERALELRRTVEQDPRIETRRIAVQFLAGGERDLRMFEDEAFAVLAPHVMARAAALTSSEDASQRAVRLFRETRTPFAAAHTDVVEATIGALEDGHSVCLFGQSGVGISTAWCAALEEAERRGLGTRTSLAVSPSLRGDPLGALRDLAGAGRSNQLPSSLGIDLSALFATSENRHADEAESRAAFETLAHLLQTLPEDGPITVLGVDAVEGAVASTLIPELMGRGRRRADLRWLVSTNDDQCRRTLEREGFQILEVRALEGRALRDAIHLGATERLRAREIPSGLVAAMDGQPRTAEWLAIALGLLLTPEAHGLRDIPSGRAWQRELDRRIIAAAAELPSDIGELARHQLGRTIRAIGSPTAFAILPMLTNVRFGIDRGTLATASGCAPIDVARAIDALGRLVVSDAEGRIRPTELLRAAVVCDTAFDAATMDSRPALITALGNRSVRDLVDDAELLHQLFSDGQDPSFALNALGRRLDDPDPRSVRAAILMALEALEPPYGSRRTSRHARSVGVPALDDEGARLILRVAGRTHGIPPARRLAIIDVLIRLTDDALVERHDDRRLLRIRDALRARRGVLEFMRSRNIAHFDALRSFALDRTTEAKESEPVWLLEEQSWAAATSVAVTATVGDRHKDLEVLLLHAINCRMALVVGSDPRTQKPRSIALAYLCWQMIDLAQRVRLKDMIPSLREIGRTAALACIAIDRSDRTAILLLAELLLAGAERRDVDSRRRADEAVQLLEDADRRMPGTMALRRRLASALAERADLDRSLAGRTRRRVLRDLRLGLEVSEAIAREFPQDPLVLLDRVDAILVLADALAMRVRSSKRGRSEDSAEIARLHDDAEHLVDSVRLLLGQDAALILAASAMEEKVARRLSVEAPERALRLLERAGASRKELSRVGGIRSEIQRDLGRNLADRALLRLDLTASMQDNARVDELRKIIAVAREAERLLSGVQQSLHPTGRHTARCARLGAEIALALGTLTTERRRGTLERCATDLVALGETLVLPETPLEPLVFSRVADDLRLLATCDDRGSTLADASSLAGWNALAERLNAQVRSGV